MSKHTPGPWEYDNGGVSRLKDHSGELRLMVDITTDSPIVGEDEANAHLIAAAPDLLEALRRARREWHVGFGVLSGETTDAIDRAIAKAEGRAEYPQTPAEVPADPAGGNS